MRDDEGFGASVFGEDGGEGGAPVAPLRVLMVASEIFPLAKTGGLADVCGALPKALGQKGVDVRLLMPAYPDALARAVGIRVQADLGTLLGERARLLGAAMPDSGLRVWLLDCPALYQRPGSPYQDPDGRDWPDNARRYGVFSHAAARVALGGAGLGWEPDIVHCHDWHTGLVPLLIHAAGAERPRTVFTVHNAAFQGNYPLDVAGPLELPRDAALAAEFYGQLSFLKAGVVFADKVTTVSPGYARELRSTEYGCGMEGIFESRAEDLIGIMNGIDVEIWNPANDPHLACNYSYADPAGKSICKIALQAELGLRADPAAPLAAFISRITEQKMADVLLACLPALMQRHPTLQFALLGRGDRALEHRFEALARAFPDRIAIEIGYHERAAHRLHAGADLLLHGSRFEPCGLTQLYAMRYGTVPVVRRVGGLADSVVDFGSASGASGFVFDAPTGEAFEAAIARSLAQYENEPEGWAALRERIMGLDFGWEHSAEAYRYFYERVAGRRAAAPPAHHAASVETRLATWHATLQRVRRAQRTPEPAAESREATRCALASAG